jgi:hypothetical protein
MPILITNVFKLVFDLTKVKNLNLGWRAIATGNKYIVISINFRMF